MFLVQDVGNKKDHSDTTPRDKTVEKWWLLTRDKIEECMDCEFRYSCFICRPRETSIGDLYGKNRLCRVNSNKNV